VRQYNSERTNRVNWIVNFTRLSILINAIFAIGKIAIGIYSLSFFLCINGFYNAGISVSKSLSIRGYKKKTYNTGDRKRDIKEEHRRLYQMGIVVIVASAVYLIYCIHMMLAGKNNEHYNQIVAITIALVTFTEIGVAIRNFIAARKSREPLMEGMKLISLATSLISLVLTQTTLMSLSNSDNIPFACGLTGIIFGSLSAIIGMYLMFRGLQFLVNENNPIYQEKFNRYMSKIFANNEAGNKQDHTKHGLTKTKGPGFIIQKAWDGVVSAYAKAISRCTRNSKSDI